MADWVLKENEEGNAKTVVKDTWEEGDDEGNIKESWEDEEEDVKDNWDEEEEEKKEVKKTPAAAKKPTTSKPAAAASFKEMTEEEKRQAVIDADLKNAQELFGLDKSLDELSISTKEDYQNSINLIYSKLGTLSNQPLYGEFIEELIKTLCKNVSLDAMKKISNSVKTIHDAKLFDKTKKAEKTKPKAKGKIKIEANQVKGDFDTFLKDAGGSGAYEEADDGDDFM